MNKISINVEKENKMNNKNHLDNKRQSKSGWRSILDQLGLLLWKNYRLQIRSIIGLAVELIIPALLAIILTPFRSIVKSTPYPNDTVFDAFSLPDNFYPSSDQKKLSIAYQPRNADSTLVQNIMASVSRDFNLTVMGM